MTKRQINRAKEYMKAHLEECRDPLTSKLDHTKLTEMTAHVFQLYEEDYAIPMLLFELALEYN